MQSIFDDDEFKQQDYATQQAVANNYFEQELADDEFRGLPIAEQDAIKLNFTNEKTRSFDEIMYEPHAANTMIENVLGSGEQEKFGNTVSRESETIFPDAQDGSTRELQQNIQIADDATKQSENIMDFYSGRVNDTDKAFNIDREHYKKAPIGDRLETALEHFNANIVDEEFGLLSDKDKVNILNNYFEEVVKPKKDELQYQHNFMNGLMNFADKALHTVTGNDEYQNLSTAREFQQSKDETNMGQVGWLGGSVAPYVAGGITAGTIPNLTKALVTDSALQGGLSLLEHGGKDTAAENVAFDVAIDTGVNLLTFGIGRKLAMNKLSKAKVIESVQSDATEMSKYEADLDSMIQPEPKTVGEIGGQKIVETVPQSKAPSHVANKLEENMRLYGNDEDILKKENSKIFKSDKLDSERQYKGMPQSEIKALDENIPLKESPPVTKEEIEEANRIFVKPEAVGGLYGFEQNEDGTYTYNVTKGLLGVAGANLAGRKVTKDTMTKLITKFGDKVVKTIDDIEQTAVKQAGGGTPPKPFYSTLEETIQQKMPNKAPVAMVKGLLKNVKADEMKFSGIDNFLEGKTTVLKEDLLRAIQQPQLNTKTLQNTIDPKNSYYYREFESVKKIYNETDSYDDFVLRLENDYDAYNDLMHSHPELKEADNWGEIIADDMFEKGSQNLETKFKDYSTKDVGTNYREDLVTLKDKGKQRIEDIHNEIQSLKKQTKVLKDNPKSEYQWLDDIEGRPQTKENIEYTKLSDEISTLEKERDALNNGEAGEQYRSAHWDESNVLYHTRKQDTKIDGKKTMLVEEIQSDWHQAGRKKGYRPSQSVIESSEKKLIQLRKDSQDITKEFGQKQAQEMNELEVMLSGRAGIPKAPYSKTWHEKAMKDIINEAVEKDYARVAWVDGKEQASRYSLSKQIDGLNVSKSTQYKDRYEVMVLDKKGNSKETVGDNFKAAELPEQIGKDLADKALKDLETQNDISYLGLDLNVGGEGMKTFYDKMLPKWTAKYIKKYGSKIEVKKLDNGQEVWSFEVTPKMKEGINTRGQALYTSPTAGGSVVGAGAGIETDEDGNITYNVKKGVIGALGGAAFGHTLGKYGMDVPKVAKGKLPNETKLQRVQRLMQDKFNRVAQLIEVKAGDDIADNMNPYQAEELFHGRAEARMKTFKDKIITPLKSKIAKSDYEIDDLDEFLKARHAEERNAKMLEVSGKENGSGMSNEEAEAILAKLDTPQMRELAKYVDAMNKTRLKLLKDEGLESEEFIDMIAGSYDNYVPLKRDMSDQFGSVVSSTGKGYDVKGKEFKRAKGSDRAVESPTMHSILNFQESLVRSEKNKVGKAFLNFTEEFPDKELYEVENLQYIPKYDKNGNIVQLDPAYKLKDNVMHVKIDGKIKQITIHDEALASAMKNLSPSELKYGLQYAHKAVRFLAGMSTSYNPEFIFSNFTRDIQTAMMNIPKEARPSRAAMARDVMPSIKGIRTGKGEWGELYKEFASEGGKTGWIDSTDIGDLSESLFKDIEKLEGKRPIRKGFDNFLEFVDDTNNAVENGVRLVAYKQAKTAGLSNKKAASIAKNLTVNFNRKGELGTVLNTAYMFANASVQGTTRMAKALSTSKAAQGGAVALVGTGFGLHMYNMDVDKENYKLVPQYIKDTNYVVMKSDGSGEYYKLPLPYGYNMLKTMGDIAGEAFTGDLPHNTITRALSAAVNAFSPIGVGSDPVHTMTPTLAKLPYELQTNQNFFGGMIRPNPKAYGADNVPDSHKSFKSVNPILKKGAEKVNELTGGTSKTEGAISVSPETIEHIMEFVSGGLGKLASNTFASTSQAIEGDGVDANKIPFKRRVKGKVSDKAELYSARDTLERSGKSIINTRDAKEFDSNIMKALKDKDIDLQYYLKLSREFHTNQAKAKFYNDNNIQGDISKEDQKKLDTHLYKTIYTNSKFKYSKGTITQKRNALRR